MPNPPLGRATTTTAAGGGNREELLGPRSAIRKQSEADAGCHTPLNGTGLIPVTTVLERAGITDVTVVPSLFLY